MQIESDIRNDERESEKRQITVEKISETKIGSLERSVKLKKKVWVDQPRNLEERLYTKSTKSVILSPLNMFKKRIV